MRQHTSVNLEQSDFDGARCYTHNPIDDPICVIELGEFHLWTGNMTPEQFRDALVNLGDRVVLAHAARSNHPEAIIEHAIAQAG